MDLPGYKINTEGHFYYVYQDRALAHAQAVSSALEELNDIPLNALTSPPILKEGGGVIVQPGSIPPELQQALIAELSTQQAVCLLIHNKNMDIDGVIGAHVQFNFQKVQPV